VRFIEENRAVPFIFIFIQLHHSRSIRYVCKRYNIIQTLFLSLRSSKEEEKRKRFGLGLVVVVQVESLAVFPTAISRPLDTTTAKQRRRFLFSYFFFFFLLVEKFKLTLSE
jgi:hypothetical protein